LQHARHVRACLNDHGINKEVLRKVVPLTFVREQ
jgi:hypothetical protein